MPVVRIPESLFKQLQGVAVPLVDTPTTVIQRLVDYYLSNHPTRNIENIENIEKDFCLTTSVEGTKIDYALVDDVKLSRMNWNKLMMYMHELAYKKGYSSEDILEMTLANAVLGEKDDSGFKYLAEADISVQGGGSNLVWRNALDLAKKLEVSVEIHFVLKEKDGKVSKGKLSWFPKGVDLSLPEEDDELSTFDCPE